MPKGKVKPLENIRALLRGTISDIEVIARSRRARSELLKTLRMADAVLGNRLAAEAGKRGGSSRFGAASAEAYQKQVQLAVGYVEKRLAGLTEAQATKAIQQSLGRTVTLMGGLEKRFTGVVRPIPLAAAGELRAAGAVAKGLWMRDFPSSVSRYGVKMLGDFERVIQLGLVTGKTNDEMVAALTAHGGPDGLFQKKKYWAERIVRTETLRAYNGARQGGFERMEKDDPTLQKKIIAILDKRTAPDSIAVNGQVRPINGQFMDGAGRQYLYPPARPNDRETTIPWHTVWDNQTNDLDEYERAVLGELSEEEENALIDRIQGKGKKPKPEKKPRAPRAKKPKPGPTATPPMDAPVPAPKVTNRERLAQGYVDDLSWTADGPYVRMSVNGHEKGSAVWYRGKWRADWYSGPNVQIGTMQYDTVEEAMDELRGLMTMEARAAASLTAEKASFDEMFDAMRADDGAATRKQARAWLQDSGVLPRDPIRNLSTAMKVDHPVTPGAEAVHGWDGSIGFKPGVLPGYAVQKSAVRGFNTVIHEELHGCTPFRTSAFYRNAGAAIEEATVEMAARKVCMKLLNSKYSMYAADAAVPVFGAYDGVIFQLEKIIAQEVGLTGKTWDVVGHLIADAGIKMRSAGALSVLGPGRFLESPEDMVDLFLGHLDVKESAKASLRSRIIAELRI